MGQKTHIKHEGRKKGNTIQYKYNNTVQHIITSCYEGIQTVVGYVVNCGWIDTGWTPKHHLSQKSHCFI